VVFRAKGRQLPTHGIIRRALVRDGPDLGSRCGSDSRVGSAAVVVNNTEEDAARFTSYAFDPNAQARSEGHLAKTDNAGRKANREPMSWLWETHPSWSTALC
jgi:hypothetical protein